MSLLIRGAALSLFMVAVGLLPGCTPIGGEGRPQVGITRAPAWGASGAITGTVRHVVPNDYAVAVYLYNESQGGWWNAPDFLAPLTSIGGDGSWSVESGAGARVQNSDVVAAFLVPSGADVPLVAGVTELPNTLFNLAVASYYLERGDGGNARLVVFSGYQWRVGAGSVAPGPTEVDDNTEQVWVDGEGKLHLTLAPRDGAWTGSALTLREPQGMGLYQWFLGSSVEDLDPNVVLSLSLYASASASEGLDIEFGRWGNASAQNAQYVVQPGDEAMRSVFDMPSAAPTMNGIDWQQDFVIFRTTTGTQFVFPNPADLIADFRYNQDGIPQDKSIPAQMALWLFNGQPPTDGQPVEVVLEGFAFTL